MFDHNLSPKLVMRLADLYPQSHHVYLLELHEQPDDMVWEYARQHNLTLVTRDVDYSELTLLRGFPPKVIWIRRGNCSTSVIEAILRANYEGISAWAGDPSTGVIELP